MTEQYSDQLNRIERKLTKVCDWIEGTSETNVGAKVRLDRLEQAEVKRQAAFARMIKAIWTIAAAAVATLAGMIWQLVAM